MKKFILNLIFIIPYLCFSFSEKDLIHYFTQHPDNKITCYTAEYIYFLKDFSCEILYRKDSYYIYFSNSYLKHNNLSKIRFINTGTSDKPNFKIIDQDLFYDKYSNTDKHFFYLNSRILFYAKSVNIIIISIRYDKGVNQLFYNDYHATFYFYTKSVTAEPSRFYLKKIFTSNSLEFYKTLDSENFSPNIPTLTLDKIKSIYQMALEEQQCFKSNFGCEHKAISLFDTIAIQNPDISKPLVMNTSRICHNIDNFQSNIYVKSHTEKVAPLFFECDKVWKFHQVLIYRASDDKKIYVLDPYFLEDGVIEYDQWRLEHLKAINNFTVELYQRLD